MENCRFCGGRGCIACPGEIERIERERTEGIKNWRPLNEEDLSFMRQVAHQFAWPDSLPDDEIDTILQLPQPMAVIPINDIGSAKNFISANALDAMTKEADGDPEKLHALFLKKAEEFRIQQRLEAQS